MAGIKTGAYGWTCPYRSNWATDCFKASLQDLYGRKIVTEADLRKKLADIQDRPEIILMHNFVMDRAAITGLCRAEGINLAWCEDGFFPHYGTMHLDPLGFCWESSLPRLVFSNVSEGQRLKASRPQGKGVSVQKIDR